MTEKDFVFWLQGFVELTETDSISDKQWLVIKDHLKLVFDKKTPDRSLLEKVTPTTPQTDWTKLSDQLSKEENWGPDFKPPYTITC